MRGRPPSSTRTVTLFPDPTPFRSRAWSERGEDRRSVLSGWLVRLRLDLSMEELLLALIQADRALRQAGWQLGLPAPDWLALSEWLRSEEHTSELQSLMRISYAVSCLQKKNTNQEIQ